MNGLGYIACYVREGVENVPRAIRVGKFDMNTCKTEYDREIADVTVLRAGLRLATAVHQYVVHGEIVNATIRLRMYQPTFQLGRVLVAVSLPMGMSRRCLDDIVTCSAFYLATAVPDLVFGEWLYWLDISGKEWC